MKRGRPQKYAWDRWFALGRFTLRRGQHYRCSVTSMAGQVRSAASQRGLSISLRDFDGDLLVEVRDAGSTSG